MTRGCFDGEFTKTEPAVPDVKYAFSDVQIEIKVDPSPPYIPEHDHHMAAQKQRSPWSGFFKFMIVLSLLVAILSAVGFGVLHLLSK